MSLTAVDAFARAHEADELPPNAKRYRELLPIERPADGEQYAFEVDLDACTGCKACVVACHSLNGLDEDESWRSVGLIQSSASVAFQQTVTAACHHCVDPACLTGCPVDAYEKDPITGIVSHLDDQCIGCSYCTLMCPYEVPRFNKEHGIVRKCDMCRGRLEVGEAPACVQSCPSGAIRISIVSKEAARESAEAGAALLPGAPLSSITVPTTIYRTQRPVPADARAADDFALRPGHGHPPLAIMLVLTQLAVGTLIASLFAGGPAAAVIAASSGLLALAASTLHLGRPLFAFRAVLGFRHSWLSREIVAFGTFAAVATAYTGATVWTPESVARPMIGALAGLVGLTGIACSVMIYAVTRRRFWRIARAAPLFLLTTVAAGAAAIAAVHGTSAFLLTAVVTATTLKLAVDLSPMRHLRDRGLTDDKRTAMLMRRELLGWLQLRVFLGVAGGVFLPVIAFHTNRGVGLAALVVLVGGELIERYLFFTAAVAPRMPGELR